jgi:TolA-binding protein
VKTWPLPAGWTVALMSALFGVGMTLGALAGSTVTKRQAEADLATLKSSHAEALATQARAASQYMNDEVARGIRLAAELLQAQSDLNDLKEQTDHEIDHLKTGRRCLDAGLLRVLDRAGAGGGTPGGVPAPTGGADAEGSGAPAADATADAWATDGDVAHWSADAQARYAECAGRLNALIEFERGRLR